VCATLEGFNLARVDIRMDWWKPIAALSVGLLTFVAVGGLVGLVEIALGSLAALTVVGLLVVMVFALSKAGTGPNRWLSNPYWGR
jgi:hypothetical protein